MIAAVTADVSQHSQYDAWAAATVTTLRPRTSEDIGNALTSTQFENLQNVDFEDDEVIVKDDN